MQPQDQSSIILIARRLVKLRLWLIPKKSRREKFFFKILRPLVMKILSFGRTTQAAEPDNFYSTHFDHVTLLRSAPLSRGDVREILIIKCDHVGDFVLSLQAFTLLRKGFPKARITLMCGPWNKDLALQTGLFDAVLPVNLFAEISSQGSLSFDPEVLKTYDLPHYDLAIDLKVESDTQFLLHYIDASFKAGFFEDLSMVLVPPKRKMPPPAMDFIFEPPAFSHQGKTNQARHAQTLLSAFASAIVNRYDARPATRAALENFVTSPLEPVLERRGQGDMIGINTGSGAAIKNWPLGYYATLIKNLITKKDVTIVLLGSSHQTPDAKLLIEQIGPNNIIDLTGTTKLHQLPNILVQLHLYIGHDTGGTHFASSLGLPTICLHTGSEPLESFQPLGDYVSIFKCMDLSCSPCGLKDLADCPYNHRCMTLIEPKLVMDECERLLGLTISSAAA